MPESLKKTPQIVRHDQNFKILSTCPCAKTLEFTKKNDDFLLKK